MGRILCVIIPMIGASPSGKAVGSGPTIRGFESLRSSQSVKIRSSGGLFFFRKKSPRLCPALDVRKSRTWGECLLISNKY